VSGEYSTDHDLILLVQELIGYSLTNETQYEVMAWLWGAGGNGKSVLIEVIRALVGALAISVDFQTLGQPGDYSLANLPGKRVAFSTESEKGGRAAERILKLLVSGEPISTRQIYQSAFEFKPTVKIWWAMNDRPRIRDTSGSVWRRLIIIPFLRNFKKEEQDPFLKQRLLAELPGILNWALEGLKRLRANGGKFTVVESVENTRTEYQVETNPVRQWLAERCEITEKPATDFPPLFEDFREWCKDSEFKVPSKTAFGTELGRIVASQRMAATKRYAVILRPKVDEVAEGFGL
jgi:putative DNA primase/helicase